MYQRFIHSYTKIYVYFNFSVFHVKSWIFHVKSWIFQFFSFSAKNLNFLQLSALWYHHCYMGSYDIMGGGQSICAQPGSHPRKWTKLPEWAWANKKYLHIRPFFINKTAWMGMGKNGQNINICTLHLMNNFDYFHRPQCHLVLFYEMICY